MRNVILIAAVILIFYGCIEISGKEPGKNALANSALQVTKASPPEHLRVGRDEAMQMRKRRQKDDASFKISVSDLQSLISNSPSAADSFIFYLAKYDVNSQREKERYLRKRPNANWNDIAKKPSTVLVGFVGGDKEGTMRLTRKMANSLVRVYDLAVVCPPPPDCACEIEQ